MHSIWQAWQDLQERERNYWQRRDARRHSARQAEKRAREHEKYQQTLDYRRQYHERQMKAHWNSDQYWLPIFLTMGIAFAGMLFALSLTLAEIILAFGIIGGAVGFCTYYMALAFRNRL